MIYYGDYGTKKAEDHCLRVLLIPCEPIQEIQVNKQIPEEPGFMQNN